MCSSIRTCEISIYLAKLEKSHLLKILSDHGGSLETFEIWCFEIPIIMALSLIFPCSLGNIGPSAKRIQISRYVREPIVKHSSGVDLLMSS